MDTPCLCRPDAFRSPCAAVLLALSLAVPAASPVSAASVGLSSVRAQTFENEDLFFYEPEVADRFGWSFASGDFNGDGYADLATGIPYDNGLAGGGLDNTGAVIVRWGGPGGLTPGIADTFLSQYASGSQSAPESNDEYGFALASGDFNGDGYADLVIGIPYWNALDVADSGRETVLYGSFFSDGFEGGSTFEWSAAVP